MKFFTQILEIVFPPRDTEVLVRNTDFSSLAAFLNPQVIYIEEKAILTLLPYRSHMVEAFIIEAKFHGNKKAQKFLGKIILKATETQKVVFVPLPLGAKRRKERGYNQTEEILKSAGLQYNPRIIVRSRDTLPQTTLGRQARLLNMKEAFSIISEPNPEITYVLFDDVVTTGATLLAAHKALVNAEAKEVFMLGLAH